MATSTRTYHPFEYDPSRHKDFKRASRHLMSKELQLDTSLPNFILSDKEAALLRNGLSPNDQDDRWEGNLADSKANTKDKEVVVRLYRTWTSSLIYEARYRPEGDTSILTLYEFAFETDKKTYLHRDLKDELQSYESILRWPILEGIGKRQSGPDTTKDDPEP